MAGAPSRRARLRLLVVALVLVVAVVLPAAAQARWGRPFEFAAPGTLDVLGPRLAVSPGGAAAAAFSLEDVDTPGSAQGLVTLRSPGGALTAPHQVPGTAQVLWLAYDGRSLELLTGTAPAGQPCCSAAQAVQIGQGGGVQRPRTLVGGLTGQTLGRLLTLADGQMLAAVGTERGVWVVQSSRANRFASPHRLAGPRQMPQALAAAPLGGGSSLVAWTAATGAAGASDPRSIEGAAGTRRRAPHGARTLVTVPRGHRIDEIGLAPRGGQATVAWVESWFDRGGAYHSVVRAQDIAPHAQARMLSEPNRLASGLTLAGDAAGDQAVAWESCTLDDACRADAAVRGRRGVFGAAQALGAIDASQPPALAVGSGGRAIAAWIRGGDPMAAVQPAPGGRFGRPGVLSRAGYALNISVAAGRHSAVAAWSQGTLHPSIVGTAFGGL